MDRWDLPKQEFLTENGQVGDCWACCIAAVLNVSRAEVPHFLQDSGNACDADTQKWLNTRQHVLVYIQGNEAPPYPRWATEVVPQYPIIACGPTERSRGLGKHHAVVYHNGSMVYDPHPSNAGLTYISEWWLVLPFAK